MQDSPYYHNTIRNIIGVFGTVFNDIKITKLQSDTTTKTVKVPLKYAPKQHYIAALMRKMQSDSSLISTEFPSISYFLDSIEYDASRKTQSLNRFEKDNSPTVKTSMYNPVPYLFNFTLNIFGNSSNDVFQIVEQIAGYFTPNVTIKVLMLPAMDIEEDVTISLNGITPGDNWEEQTDTNRLISWQLGFQVKGHLYPPIRDVKIITNAIINIEDITVDPDGYLLEQVHETETVSEIISVADGDTPL